MKGNLFKTRAYSNATAIFVHTYLGHDGTGDGTREYPYRRMSQALASLNGRTAVVFRGVVNEAFTATVIVVGDDINQVIIRSQYNPRIDNSTNLTFDSISNITSGITVTGAIITNVASFTETYTSASYNQCKIKTLNNTAQNYMYVVLNSNTVENFSMAVGSYSGSTSKNCLVSKSTVAPSVYQKYFVYSSKCVFSGITQPIFTNNSAGNIQLLRNAYNDQNLFAKDAFGNETHLVIREERDGGNHPNIFNRYQQANAKISVQVEIGNTLTITVDNISGDIVFPASGKLILKGASGVVEQFIYTSKTAGNLAPITFTGLSQAFTETHIVGETCIVYGDVLDFTLNPDVRNEALWASDTGGYVGCYAPVLTSKLDTTIIDVLADGTPSGINPDMLIQTTDKSHSFLKSLTNQVWNRASITEVFSIPQGGVFKAGSLNGDDGSPLGFHFGKKQNLMVVMADGHGLTEDLEYNTTYKVSNPNNSDVSKAIMYGNTQVLPYFFFNTKCIGTVSVTAGSNIVTGYGTTFTKFFVVGQEFSIPNSNAPVGNFSPANVITKIITFITSEGSMTLDSNYTASRVNVLYKPPLKFTVEAGNTTTRVIKVANTPLESIEIIPLDELGSASIVQPKFSANGAVSLLVYNAAGAARYGRALLSPVLFNHIGAAIFGTGVSSIKDDFITNIDLGTPANNRVVPTRLAIAVSAGNTSTITLLDASSYPIKGRIFVYGRTIDYTNRVGNVLTISQTLPAIPADMEVYPDTIVDDRIAYYKGNFSSPLYDGWQISNADQEYVTLAASSYFSVITPALQKMKLELNGHFDVHYDL